MGAADGRGPRALASALGLLVCVAAPAAAWQTALPAGYNGYALVSDGIGSLYAAGQTSGRFAVFKVDDGSGELLWTSTADDPGGVVRDVAVTSTGDPVAVGTAGQSFVVARFDGSTGGKPWELALDGDGAHLDEARAVAIDAADDVFVGGILQRTGVGNVVTVAKLDGSTGTEDWRVEVAGTAFSDHFWVDVAVDSAGDVFAVGTIVSSTTGDDALVLKLDGSTGTELWRVELDGGGAGHDHAYGVTLTSAQDAVISTILDNTPMLVRLDGPTGAEEWRSNLGRTALRLTIDAADQVFAVFEIFGVGKFDGATGTEIWSRDLSSGPFDNALDLVVDASGDVYGAGRFGPVLSSTRGTVVKFSGTSGNVLWRRDLQSTWFPAITLDGDGDVAAVGDEVIVDLDPSTGIVGPVPGKRLLVREKLGDPSSRKIVAVLAQVASPAPGSADDPTTAGAAAALSNPSTGESATFSLPAVGWRGLGTPPGVKGYRYNDSSGTYGPCKTLKVVPGKVAKLTCVGKIGSIPFSLDEPSQGELVATIQLGSARSECGIFGGIVKKDVGLALPSPIGIFKAKLAAPFGNCPVP